MAKPSVNSTLLKAKTHAKMGEIEEAQNLYQAVLQAFPKNKRAQQGLATLKKTKLPTINKSPPQKTINNLLNLYNQGQLSSVVKEAQAIIRKYPAAFVAWNVLGAAAAQTEQLDKAIFAFQKVLDIKPNNPEAYYNMGKVFQDQGKLEEAIDAYRKAFSLKPDYADAYNNMGNAFKNLGNLEKAIEAYSKAISIQPNYANAYNNIGNAFQGQGKLEKAIGIYKQALSLRPDYAEAYYNMGNAFKEQGKLAESIKAYKKAIAIKPDYADAYNNLGNAHNELGEFEKAIEIYNKVLLIKPDFAEGFNSMGNALKVQGKLDEAVKAYKKALAIKPDYGEAKHILSSLTGETTNSAPRDYVENLFDDYANKFDNSLLQKLEYKIPKTLSELAVKEHGSGSLGSILDLGCGTGLTGLELKDFCSYLEGIDLSYKMLEQAKIKKIYDKLTHVDITEYLLNAELNFNYFFSTDVFIYLGDLSDVFRLIKTRNKNPGRLIFSTEHSERNGFQLEKSGRYSHSYRYIESLCSEFNYSISHFSKTNLRKESGNFLVGGLYILNF